VERARELLVAGVDPSHAAVAVGFYDHSHLARHMRRLLGISPSVLRPPRRSS
jgi:AraC-like DNA-binding protein